MAKTEKNYHNDIDEQNDSEDERKLGALELNGSNWSNPRVK